MTLESLLKILKKNPLEATRVIAVIDGKPITLAEAIDILRKGGALAERLLEELRKIGIDPPAIPEEWWEIAYQRYAQKPPTFVIYYKGRKWTRDDILREIANRTPIGEEFVKMEMEYLQELMK